MEYLLLIAGIVIGWVVGRFHLTLQIMEHAQQLLKQPLESLLMADRPNASVLRTTVSDKYVYLYDKKTDEFLCQDSTLEKTVAKAFSLGIIKPVTIVEHDNSYVLVHQGIIVEESTDET